MVKNLKWVSKIKRRAKGRRIPEAEGGTFLASLDFASALRGLMPDTDEQKALALARELHHAADWYFYAADLEATRSQNRKGRPKSLADPLFVYAMAIIWKDYLGLPLRWRIWNWKAGNLEKQRSGAEQPTSFQKFCIIWMNFIDRDRNKPITAASIRTAKNHFNKRR